MSDSSSLVRCHHSCFRVDRGQGIAIRARSRGFVHIFFALAVCLGLSVWGISEVLRYVTETRQTAEQRELESLHRARRALLNYIVLPPPDLPGQNEAFNVFGFGLTVDSLNSVTMTFSQEFRRYELPCPDVFDANETSPRLDGIADYSGLADYPVLPVCGQTDNPLESGSWVGRFPWRSLSGAGTVFVRGAGGEDLRDSAKERLWYAVSPNLLPSNQPHRPPLNLHYLLSREDWLTVTDARGEIVSDRVAALVIAPREQSGEHIFGLFEDTPRSDSPTPADTAAAYLDEENRDGDRVFVNSDSYRGAAFGPESDANQTLDLLARVHIEDFPDAPPPDSRLCDSAVGGDSAAIGVLRAHLIQRGSLPDPAVFEEEAATVTYRLPGFSPSRGDAVGGAVTVSVLSVSTTVNSPEEYMSGYVVIPSLFINAGVHLAPECLLNLPDIGCNPETTTPFDTFGVFVSGGTTTTITGFQIIPRLVSIVDFRRDEVQYAVRHRGVNGDLDIGTDSNLFDFVFRHDQRVSIHGFPFLDSNFNPDYGVVETTITTGVAVRASLIQRGATVVDTVEMVVVGGVTIPTPSRLLVDGDSLPPFFIWPGSSIAVEALLDLDPEPPFNAAIAALETRYVLHNEARVPEMLARADPLGSVNHLPRQLFGEGGSAPTFAEPVGGAVDKCFAIESARTRSLDEGELIMELAGPAIGYFREGSLSRLVKKITGEKIEDSPVYGAGVLLPPGTLLRARFGAGNIGELILPRNYSVCGKIFGNFLVTGGTRMEDSTKGIPVRLRARARAEVVSRAEVLSGGGEPVRERPGGARPGMAAIAGNTGFFPIHSIDDQFPQNFDRVNPFYRFERYSDSHQARLSGEAFGFFPCGADLAFTVSVGVRGAPIAPAGALDRAIAARDNPLAERPSDEFMLDLSRPQFFPPDTDYLIPSGDGNTIDFGDDFAFPPGSFARLPENSKIIGTYVTEGLFRQFTELTNPQESLDYRTIIFPNEIRFGGTTAMTVNIGGTDYLQVDVPSNVQNYVININGVEYRSQFSDDLSGILHETELLAGYNPNTNRFVLRNVIYRDLNGVIDNLDRATYIVNTVLTSMQVDDLNSGQGPVVPNGSISVIVAAPIITGVEVTRQATVTVRHVVLPNGDDYYSGIVESRQITLTLELPNGAMIDVGGARLADARGDQSHGFQLNVKGAVDVCADPDCQQRRARAEEGAMLLPYAGIFVEPRKVKIPLGGKLILPSETRMQFITHPLTHPVPVSGGNRYEYRAEIGGVPEVFNFIRGRTYRDRERRDISLENYFTKYHGGDFSGGVTATAPDDVAVYWDENDRLFLPPGAIITFSADNEQMFPDPQSGILSAVSVSLVTVARRFCGSEAGEEARIGNSSFMGRTYLEVCDETPGSMHAIGFSYWQGINQNNVPRGDNDTLGGRVGNVTVFRIEDIDLSGNTHPVLIQQAFGETIPPGTVAVRYKTPPVASTVTIYRRPDYSSSSIENTDIARRYFSYPVLEESPGIQRPTYAASVEYQSEFVVPAGSYFYDDEDPNLVGQFPADSKYYVPRLDLDSDYVLTLAVSTDDLDVDRRGALRRNVVLRLDADAIVNTPDDGQILAPAGSIIDVARREIIPPFGVHSLESAGADAAWVSAEEVVGYVREDVNLLAPSEFERYVIGRDPQSDLGRLREFLYDDNRVSGSRDANFNRGVLDGYDFSPLDQEHLVTTYIRDNQFGGRQVVYARAFNMIFSRNAPDAAGTFGIGFRDYPVNLRAWRPELKILTVIRMSPGGQLYQSDFTENDLASKLAGLRVPRGSFLFSPRGDQTRAYPADLDAAPGAPGRSGIGFEQGQYIFVPGGLTATYARVVSPNGIDVFIKQQSGFAEGELLATSSNYEFGAIPGPAYIELYNPDQPNLPGFRLAGRDNENIVFMPARNSYVRVAEIIENNNEVVLRTTGQRHIDSYFSPTQWDYRGVARRDLSSGIYSEFLPLETASLLENFPLIYAVAPECREQWRGTSGKECASLEGEGLTFLLQPGEEVPLPSARNIPRGHTRVQAAVAGRPFVVDRLHLQEVDVDGVPRHEYAFLESATVTAALQFNEDGRITRIDAETWTPSSFTAHEDRLVLRAPAGGFLARIAAAENDLESASSGLHTFEWDGDLTVNVGGYTGEFGDEGFVPARVFSNTTGDSLLIQQTVVVIEGTVYTTELFPSPDDNDVYPHYHHAYRYITVTPGGVTVVNSVSSDAPRRLQDFSVVGMLTTMTIQPPQQLALGAGTRAVEGGGVYFGPGSRVMVSSRLRAPPLVSVIRIVGDFEKPAVEPRIDNDDLFQASPSDRDQFGDLAGPVNVSLDLNGNPTFVGPNGPGAGLERTRVLRGAGASLPANYFTRYIPEVALETRFMTVTVTSIEPIYRDISGFYSDELDMEIELGSDLRAIDEITGEMGLTRAGERINLKLGGVDGSEVAPDSGEFFIDIGSSRITMLPGYVWQGYLPAPGDYLDAPVMMTFSANEFAALSLYRATITVGRPPLTIALPQRRAPSVKFLGANLTLANAVGEAILKNSAGTAPASNYVPRLNYEISLGFESTEYDRLSLDTNSATREEIITLDGYFEPVAQALINSSSPHLNIWGGGLDRPEFLDSDYEFGVQRDLKIGRDVMFSRDVRFSDIAGIVNDDDLTVVRRPAYEVTVEVESRTPGAEPQRRMVVLTASARDATPTRTDSFAYLTDGASYEGVALSVSSRELCPALPTGFGNVALLVEPDVPLAGSVRYARPRYDSAMVGGKGAREAITLTLSEYSDSTLFYDENSLLSPAGLDGSVFVSLQIHHESTYPGDAFSFYDGVSGPVAPVTLIFTSDRAGPPRRACTQDPTYDTTVALRSATLFIFSSCPPTPRSPGWMADFYIAQTGGATIARARAPYDIGSPPGNTTVIFANRVVGGVKNFSVDDSNIPMGHNAFPVDASVVVQVNPTLSSNFQDTVFAVQYEAGNSNNILSVPFNLPYYNAVSSPLSIAYHHNAANIVTVRTLDLPSIDTPLPGRFQGAAFQVRSEPAEVIDIMANPNNDYVWGKNAPPRSFRLADQNHGLRVDLSTPRTVPLIGDMFVFLDRGYDPTRFGGELQTMPLGDGFKIEGYAALVSPLGASGNDDGARYAYAQRSEIFSALFDDVDDDSRPFKSLREIYDFIDTGNCGGGCAALFNSPEWAAVLSGVIGLQAVNVDFSDRTDRWRENIYFVLPHDVVAIRSDRSGLMTANPPQPEITLSVSFPREELPGVTLMALDYSTTINLSDLSDAGVSYMSGDYRALANGEAVVIELRAVREDGNDSVVRFALTPETVVSVSTVLAGVRGGDVNVWRISIASSYTRLDDDMVVTETAAAEIPLAENPYARLSRVTRIGSQPVTLLAGSLLYPHSGRVVPASRFPGSGNIRLIRNGGTIAAIGAIDGAYRQPLPVGGLHGSRFGFYKGELAPLDVVSPAADCFARVVDIVGREERIDVEGAYRVGDAPDFLTQPVPYYERTMPLLNAVELDYTGAISPTLTAAMAMMNNFPNMLENANVTLSITGGNATVDLSDSDIYESGSAGALFAGEDVIITMMVRGSPRTIYLRLADSDSLRYFEHTGDLMVPVGLIDYNLADDSTYTGVSFADLVFARSAGIVQRLTLTFNSNGVVAMFEYDRDGLNACSFTGFSCHPATPTNANDIDTALAGYPQGTIPINTDGLNRPVVVLRDGSFSATINLADNTYYTAGQYSRLRAGLAVTVSPDIGSVPRHEFEIFPTGGGRHRVRPLLPSHIYMHNGRALNTGGGDIRNAGRNQVGNVSYTVNMAIDASYNTDSDSLHNAPTSDIYSSLYAHQQMPSGDDNLTAAFSLLAVGDRNNQMITVILRVRPGASRIAFCTPTTTPNPRCEDVLNGRITLVDPNTLPGAPNPAAEYSVFLPLPVFDLFPTINLTAPLPNTTTLTRNVFLGHPTLYAADSNYGLLQSGSPVDLNPTLFVQDGYTVHFRLTPLGRGALSVGYRITPGDIVGGYLLPFIDLPLLLIGAGRTEVDLNDPAFYAPDPADPARPIFLTLAPGIIGAVDTRELNLLSGHEFLDERLVGPPASTSDLLGKLLLDRDPLCDAPNRRGALQFCVQRANNDEIALYQIGDRGSAVTLAMSDLGFNAYLKTPQRNECVPLVGYSPANSYPYGRFRIGTVPTPTVYSCVRIVGGAGDEELLFRHFIAGNENGQPFREERFPYSPTGTRVELIPVSVVATIGYPTYEILLGNPERDPVLTIDLNDPRSYLDGTVRADFPSGRVALITLTLTGVTLEGSLDPQPQTLYLQDATAPVSTDFNFVALPANITVAARFDGKISINSYAAAEPLLPSDRLVFIEEPLSDREVVVEPGELRFVSEWHGGGNGPFLVDSAANNNSDRYLRSQPPNPYSSEYYAPIFENVPGSETQIATGDKTDFQPVRTWHFIEAERGDLLNINSPNISLGGDRMEDPHRREYEPVGNIYEMTADPGYWASAQPQLSHTRANYIVGGLSGFGGGLSVSMTIVGGETRMVTVASPDAFADGRAFAIVNSRGVANPSGAANYRTPYRQTPRPFGWKFLTRSQTPAMPLRDAFSSVPQYYNVWYRLRDDSRYMYSDSNGNTQPDIGIPAGSIVNPVQGTYVTPPSQFAAIGADGANIRYHNRFGSLNSDLNLRPPAMILPAGAIYIVGGLPQLPNESDEDYLNRLPRITNVQAAVFFSVRPLSGIGCELASEPRFPDVPVQVVVNQQAPVSLALRNAASVAIEARPSPSEERDRYIKGIENFTLGHPCEWLDEIENSDGDSLFFYHSRDAIGGDLGARHVGNDRTYIMGGRIRFSRL